MFDHMNGLWSGYMGIFWVLLLVLVVWLLLRDRRGGSRRHTSAREVLDQRYARGEIDREEYLRRLDDLRKD